MQYKYDKNTPICLPRNRPRTMPSGTLSSNEANDKPSKDTPAFANANKGIRSVVFRSCAEWGSDTDITRLQ